MALLDNDYVRCTLSDGSQRYLPVAKGTTCAQRPTPAQATALIPTMLLEGFAPSGNHLESKGCVISPDIVVIGSNTGYQA